MDVGFDKIFAIGFADGIVWFPLVLGVGLLYTYFKEIDVSVDGIAVLSGIGCAFVWNQSGSYVLSLLAGIAIGIASSSVVCGIQIFFRISGLMAGIVFSLAAHSLSVVLIGESLVMPKTYLISGFGTVAWWQIAIVVLLAAITWIFYNTRFGLAARKLGNGCIVNTVYSAGLLKCSAYALSGLLYGLGGAMYAHSQGLAKSGGSFEFLLVSLCAYMCTVRFADVFSWLLRQVYTSEQGGRVATPYWMRTLSRSLSLPATNAFVGAIIFETLLFFTIVVSPNPMTWKLVFSALLLLALAGPYKGGFLNPFELRASSKVIALKLRNVSVHYDIGSDRRQVFKSSSADFSQGINLIRGPNGTGKSTLLKTIAGIVRMSEGQMRFNGHDLAKVNDHARPSFLLQQNPMDTLAADLTVAEALFVSLYDHGPLAVKFNEDSVLDELFTKLNRLEVSPIREKDDLFWGRRVITLSGGEAHCVAFYCALLSGAPILLADEPTTGLDVGNFEKLTTLVSALARDRIILLTSHDSRVTTLADWHFTVGGGQIRFDGKREEPREQPA